MTYPVIPPSAWTPDYQPPAAAHGGSTFFQIGWAGHEWDVLNARKAWSLGAPDLDTVRLEVRDGDVMTWDAVSGQGSSRSELSTIYDRRFESPAPAGRCGPVPLGEIIHVGFGLLVEPGPRNTAAWLVMGQNHFDWADPKNPGKASPPVSLCLAADSDVMTVNTGHTDAGGANVNGPVWTDVAPLVRGRRYQIDLFIKLDPAGAGRLVACRDGIKLVDYNGPLGYVGQGPSFWKIGPYRNHGPTEPFALRADHLVYEWGDAVSFPPDDPILEVSRIEGPFSDGTRRATVEGTTTPGTDVTWTRDGRPAGVVVADASGHFTYRFALEHGGQHMIVAAITGAPSASILVRDADF